MTTCQVCGREIKDNTGVIAHHGYQRPGEGWQTASCFGARYPAYEASHDRLDEWIKRLDQWIPERMEALLVFKELPPPAFIVGPKRGHKYIWQQTVTMPENFDPSKRPSSFQQWSYEQAFWSFVYDRERDIKGMEAERKRSVQRREAWKPLFPITRSVAMPC